jgi:citrate synthase
VRLVGSAQVSLYAAISAGICALWGPLHGGANQAVVEMLEGIEKNGGEVAPFIQRARDKSDSFRLMGFGHRVYKTYDPRARIMKKVCHNLLKKLNQKAPLLERER